MKNLRSLHVSVCLADLGVAGDVRLANALNFFRSRPAARTMTVIIKTIR